MKCKNQAAAYSNRIENMMEVMYLDSVENKNSAQNCYLQF